MQAPRIVWFLLTRTKHLFLPSNRSRPILVLLVLGLLILGGEHCPGQTTNGDESLGTKRVLMIFSEARDLPGNVMMEQAVRQEMLAHSTNNIDFFSESLDSSRFPDKNHYRLFGDYIKNKYTGQKIDLMILFIARNFLLAQGLTTAVPTNVPAIFVVVNDLDVPNPPGGRPFTGIFQRFDIPGTMQFIFRLQPETRRVVVIGGVSDADRVTLARIQEMAQNAAGVTFEFWTNLPVGVMCADARTLPDDTVILLGTVQRDVTGEPFYTSQVVQMLAPNADVPVYVLGQGLIGSGALGGIVVNSENMGTEAGKLALRALAGESVNQIPLEQWEKGTPMVDWRELQHWHIRPGLLPSDTIERYRPTSLWDEHKYLIVISGAALVTQGITIIALLALRSQQRRAVAEIERQRTELAHVSRVSTMGQLASALTHELNQPLGAILRNAEAAELYLQNDPPNLQEVRAILTDIRRDDRRAGNVIDRMRALYKRKSLVLNPLDLRELVEDTVALIRADADARHVKVTVHLPAELPRAQGDRVHLQQVLLNLIINGMDAMAATPRARRLLQVRALVTKNENLKVEVSDHGTGVAPDVAARIFEPFFTTKPNGMGMGLAISQTIIEAHGGDIWVQSKGGEGTTFSFILPPAGEEKVKDGDLPASL